MCLSLDGGRGDSEDRVLWEPAGYVAVWVCVERDTVIIIVCNRYSMRSSVL